MADERWSTTTLQDAYELFLLDCRAQKLTPTSIDFYRHRLPKFFDWCAQQGVTSIEQLKPTHIKAYLVHRSDDGASDGYLHGIARVIRRFCNFCVEEELVTASPMRKVKMPRVAKKILRSFDRSEFDKLMGACRNHRDRATLLFLVDSGVRVSEFVNLNWEHVSMDTGQVFIHKGKMQKDRYVYIGARTRKALKRLQMSYRPKPDSPLIPSKRDGERLKPNGLRLLLKRIAKRAQLKQVSPHAFRRTFALWSLRAGMNVYVLMRLMGHESLDVLLRYLGLTKDDLAQGHADHGPVDNL